jgi:hypothetical protein
VPRVVVERIIDARGGGDSLRTIAGSLTADGVPTAQGGAKWHASTIKAVLEGQDAAALCKPLRRESRRNFLSICGQRYRMDDRIARNVVGPSVRRCFARRHHGSHDAADRGAAPGGAAVVERLASSRASPFRQPKTVRTDRRAGDRRSIWGFETVTQPSVSHRVHWSLQPAPF